MAVPDVTPVLWLCGPTAVGKSTIGYELFTQVNRSGITAAYVDLAQVGFCRPVPGGDPDAHRLKAANVGALWPVFREAGARCLVMTGGVGDRDTVRAYADALPGTELTLCRLVAGREPLTERILLRGRGGGPAIMGDALRGLPIEHLRRIAERAVREGEALERAGIGDVCVNTDRGSVTGLARLVRDRAGGWPRL